MGGRIWEWGEVDAGGKRNLADAISSCFCWFSITCNNYLICRISGNGCYLEVARCSNPGLKMKHKGMCMKQTLKFDEYVD